MKGPKFQGSCILISPNGSILETKAEVSLVSLVSLFASPYEGVPITDIALKSNELPLLTAGLCRPCLSASCFPSSKNLNLCFPSPIHGILRRWHREHGGVALTAWHCPTIYIRRNSLHNMLSRPSTFCFCLRHPSQPRLEGTPGIAHLDPRCPFTLWSYFSK